MLQATLRRLTVLSSVLTRPINGGVVSVTTTSGRFKPVAFQAGKRMKAEIIDHASKRRAAAQSRGSHAMDGQCRCAFLGGPEGRAGP